MLLGHSDVPHVHARSVYIRDVRVCMWKHARMTAQRVRVHGFKNCALPSWLLGCGKQTRVSAIERDKGKQRRRNRYVDIRIGMEFCD